MTPIKLTFQSKASLTVYSEDPNAFCDTFTDSRPPEIADVELGETDQLPKLQEVRLFLRGGLSILCYIAVTDIAKAEFIEEITACTNTRIMTYGNLMKYEAELDDRFTAVCAVINNIPDLDTRHDLHKEYLKRKSAYVSAVEALIDGAIRRPSE